VSADFPPGVDGALILLTTWSELHSGQFGFSDALRVNSSKTAPHFSHLNS
jgi:hypothetical protein